MPQVKDKHNLTLRTSNIQVRKDENGKKKTYYLYRILVMINLLS